MSIKDRAIVTIMFISVVLLPASCTKETGREVVDTSQAVTAESLEQLTPEQARVTANRWRQENIDGTAYFTTEAVVFELSDNESVEIPLPENRMIVAIAPYVNATHPCSVHYVTGCQGELADQEFHVTAKNMQDEVILNQLITAMDNGFFELWLERGQEVELTVTYEGKTSTQNVSSYSDSDTCITTMKLL